jgi:hypothetical protein
LPDQNKRPDLFVGDRTVICGNRLHNCWLAMRTI